MAKKMKIHSICLKTNKEAYLVMDLQLTPRIKCFITIIRQKTNETRVSKREIFYHGNVSSSFVIPVYPNSLDV